MKNNNFKPIRPIKNKNKNFKGFLFYIAIAVRPADPPSASRRCDTVPPSGEGSDIKKSKNVSKKKIYTSGEGSDTKKSKKHIKKNSLHFWGKV